MYALDHKWLLAALLLFTCAVYALGLGGGFEFDDQQNIVNNQQLHIHDLGPNSVQQAANSGFAGPTGRPLAMLSFGLNYYFQGLSPTAFKLTNLLIHILNGIGLYGLVSLWLRSPRLSSIVSRPQAKWVALLATALWLLHPIQLTAVLYVVQRMTSMAATGLILGLLCYSHGRQQQLLGRHGSHWLMASFVLCMPLALAAKETGLLLPALCLVLELCLYGFAARAWLKPAYGLLLITPAMVACLWLVSQSSWLEQAYQYRNYDIGERLLTQARALWFYVGQLLLPTPSSFALFHDDFGISRGWLQPVSSLLAVAAWCLTITAALLLRNRWPLFSFAVLFFLANQLLESSIYPLEMVFEHRNYLACAGLFLWLAVMVTKLFDHDRLRMAIPRWNHYVLTSSALAVLVCSGITANRALTWSDPLTFRLAQYQHHPDSVRANVGLGQYLAKLAAKSSDPAQRQRWFEQASLRFEHAASLQPDLLAPLLASFTLHRMLDKPTPTALLTELERRLSQEALPPSTEMWLTELVELQAQPLFQLPPEQMVRLLQAGLNNQQLAPALHAGIATVAARYALLALGDQQTALAFASLSVRRDPNDARNHLNLARVLRLNHLYDDALSALGEAESLDWRGQHAQQIQLERRKLNLKLRYGQQRHATL